MTFVFHCVDSKFRLHWLKSRENNYRHNNDSMKCSKTAVTVKYLFCCVFTDRWQNHLDQLNLNTHEAVSFYCFLYVDECVELA